jgi:hypothetical protein
MKLAKVVAVHPESHSVDLLVMDDGRRLPGVQVMSPFASSSHGLAGLARPKSQDLPDPYSAPFDGKRDIIACVGFYRDAPIVMGFLFPQVSQVLFSDYDRVMDRSPSDAYWTIDKDGNSEYFHPSGTYIRVAVNPEHEDLTGKDADKIWKIEPTPTKRCIFTWKYNRQASGRFRWIWLRMARLSLTQLNQCCLRLRSSPLIHLKLKSRVM